MSGEVGAAQAAIFLGHFAVIQLPDNATLRLMFPRAAEADIAALRKNEGLMARVGILASASALAMFLCQMDHESQGMARKVESLNYSVEGLMETFGRHRISAADCKKFGRAPGRKAHQNAIANIVYGGAFGRTQLGNTEPGDGWRFRGRGGLQVTGRYGYRRVGAIVGLPLEAQPELAETPDGSMAVSIGVWVWKGFDKLLAGPDPVLAVTKKLNGGVNGLADRRTRYKLFLDLING
jgi:putative chitinase